MEAYPSITLFAMLLNDIDMALSFSLSLFFFFLKLSFSPEAGGIPHAHSSED